LKNHLRLTDFFMSLKYEPLAQIVRFKEEFDEFDIDGSGASPLWTPYVYGPTS